MTYVIQTHELTKVFDGKKVVSNVSLNIKQNEIYGFLGPNGAGKTTVMKMITNLLKPTKGEIELFDERLTKTSYNVLKRMSSIIEYPVFYDHLSGKTNLELHREYMGFYSPNCVENALEMLNLENTGNKAVSNYSLGMRQRLGIARAILTKPELLILDEPMNGLDPAGMKQIRNLLKMLNKEYGVTILISSHLLSEIESVADTVGILHYGKLLNEISMSDIRDMTLAYIELSVNDVQKASVILSDTLDISNFKIFDNKIIRIYDDSVTPADISHAMGKNNIVLDAIGKKSETLEDYFLKITSEVR